jgi:predicted DNA-binding antitoxin AbrB/MazE fold protein
MRTVEALYEDGLLKPQTPLSLRPGERVGVIVVRQPDPSRWNLDRLAREAGRCFAGVSWPFERGGGRLLQLFDPRAGSPSVVAETAPGESAFCLGGSRLLTSGGELLAVASGEVVGDLGFPAADANGG